MQMQPGAVDGPAPAAAAARPPPMRAPPVRPAPPAPPQCPQPRAAQSAQKKKKGGVVGSSIHTMWEKAAKTRKMNESSTSNQTTESSVVHLESNLQMVLFILNHPHPIRQQPKIWNIITLSIKSERRLMSGSKMKEMTGSGIFAEKGENGDSESSNPANRTSVRMYQQTVAGISQISFSADGSVSPKKPSSLPEVAKQRELSGTFESDAEAKLNKQLSEAKNKELSGSNIFGPPPETPARPLAARNMELQGNVDFALPRSVHTSVKVSNPAGGQSNITFSEDPVTKTAKKIHNQKFQELTGNNIFKEEASPGSADKSLSSAKLKEMSGNDIFSDGKASSRDYLGGVRKPPGGGSSIALI